MINGFHSKIVLNQTARVATGFVDSGLREAAGIGAGDINVEVVPSKEWPEPEVPADLKQALASGIRRRTLFMDADHPMARWDWLRWIRATHNPETRSRRIEVALSKIKAGERRPCCFNRNQCTEPEVSKMACSTNQYQHRSKHVSVENSVYVRINLNQQWSSSSNTITGPIKNWMAICMGLSDEMMVASNPGSYGSIRKHLRIF